MNKLDGTEGTAVVLENVSPCEYRGKRTISTTPTTVIKKMGANPTVEQRYLNEWWEPPGNEEEFGDLVLDQEPRGWERDQ